MAEGKERRGVLGHARRYKVATASVALRRYHLLVRLSRNHRRDTRVGPTANLFLAKGWCMSGQLPKQCIPGPDLGSHLLCRTIIGRIDGKPKQLIRAGARVFDDGMEATFNPAARNRET